MSGFWRQIGALLWLTGKQMRRGALRAGEAPRTGPPVRLLLMMATYLYLGGVFYSLGARVGALESGRISALRLLVWSMATMSLATSIIWSAPQIGRIRPILRSSLLDVIPVGGAARAVVGWLQGAAFIFATPILLLAAAPEARDPLGVAYVLALALFGSLAGALVGQAFAALARVLASGLLVRVFPWLGVVLAIAPFLALMNAPVLGPRLNEDGHDPMLQVARAIIDGGGGRALVVGAYLALTALAAAALWAVERIGYDREDRPAGGRYRGGALGSPTRIELRLAWRQGTAKMHAFQMVFMVGLLGVAVALVLDQRKLGSGAHTGLIALVTQAVLMSSLTMFQTASTAIARDLGARPFLSALPTTPAQTLTHKASALKVLSAPLYVGLGVVTAVLLARTPVLGGAAVGTALRVVLVGVGLWLVAGIAPAVSFLTRGLGAQEGARQGMPSIIVSALVLLPLISIVVVPSWPQALASLAVLAALAFEARRSAARCVTWLDDSGEVDRDTPVWRALLALGGFFATQSLAGQALMFAPLDDALRMALVYLAGGVALVVLTLRARPRVEVSDRSPLLELVGLCAGLASGGAALLFALGLRALGAELPELHSGVVGRVALVIAVVVVAPLCEELFFRGWLQPAIARELGPRRRWAPLIGALAFAGAHVGSAIVPQLVLGLVAGLLYARSGRLRPGILAHAAHNAVVVLLGG
jgi:membrane protease YdiL (CAAX protease family)